jgi:hypothetical protein
MKKIQKLNLLSFSAQSKLERGTFYKHFLMASVYGVITCSSLFAVKTNGDSDLEVSQTVVPIRSSSVVSQAPVDHQNIQQRGSLSIHSSLSITGDDITISDISPSQNSNTFQSPEDHDDRHYTDGELVTTHRNYGTLSGGNGDNAVMGKNIESYNAHYRGKIVLQKADGDITHKGVTINSTQHTSLQGTNITLAAVPVIGYRPFGFYQQGIDAEQLSIHSSEGKNHIRSIKIDAKQVHIHGEKRIDGRPIKTVQEIHTTQSGISFNLLDFSLSDTAPNANTNEHQPNFDN